MSLGRTQSSALSSAYSLNVQLCDKNYNYIMFQSFSWWHVGVRKDFFFSSPPLTSSATPPCNLQLTCMAFFHFPLKHQRFSTAGDGTQGMVNKCSGIAQRLLFPRCLAGMTCWGILWLQDLGSQGVFPWLNGQIDLGFGFVPPTPLLLAWLM